MRTSAIFSVISLIVLSIGSVISWVSYCDDKLKKSIFIASGLYVLSGIFLLIGIVLYVGCISQAFDSKSDNTGSENSYLYEYGISFYLSVTAFVLSEFAGVFCIYLYIAKQKHLLKTLNGSELFIKTNSDEEIMKIPNFNHIDSQNIIHNPSEISPISNISQPSYHAYRRYSEQLLLKLYPNIENISQYSSPTKTSSSYNRTVNENRLNRENVSFIPEFRASQASPIIDYFNKKESKENVYESSQMVIFYNDSKLDNSPINQDKMANSLILNQKTYFDSPLSESLSENNKTINLSNICNTCNLSLNLCNCACALLCLDKSSIKDQKIYSHTNNVFPLPSAIYHNNHHYCSNNSNNINNNDANNAISTINKSVEFEKLIQINTNATFSLNRAGKQRKITAV